MGYQNPLLQTERHSVTFIDVIYPLLSLKNDKAKPKGGQNELLIFLSSPERCFIRTRTFLSSIKRFIIYAIDCQSFLFDLSF